MPIKVVHRNLFYQMKNQSWKDLGDFCHRYSEVILTPPNINSITWLTLNLWPRALLNNTDFTCHIDVEMGQKLDPPILETGVKTRNSFARALNNIAIENSLAEGESKRALRSSARFYPQTENKENNAPERTLKLKKQEKESIDVVSTTRLSRASNKAQKVNYLK